MIKLSYRIEYDSRIDKFEVRSIRHGGRNIFLLMGIGFLAVSCLAPEYRNTVRSFLIPGEDAVTTLAFQTMSEDLRSGANLADAFYEFCRMVIHGG